jgi:hypothetical protein
MRAAAPVFQLHADKHKVEKKRSQCRTCRRKFMVLTVTWQQRRVHPRPRCCEQPPGYQNIVLTAIKNQTVQAVHALVLTTDDNELRRRPLMAASSSAAHQVRFLLYHATLTLQADCCWWHPKTKGPPPPSLQLLALALCSQQRQCSKYRIRTCSAPLPALH